VLLPSGVRNTFAYRADGLRVRKGDSSGTQKAIWDGQKLLAETDATDVTEVIYTMSPGIYRGLVSQRRSGSTNYFHFDPLGSTDRMTDGAQTVTDTNAYNAFGTILSQTGSTSTPFRYLGKLAVYRITTPSLYDIPAVGILSSSIGRYTGRVTLLVLHGGNAYAFGVSMAIHALLSGPPQDNKGKDGLTRKGKGCLSADENKDAAHPCRDICQRAAQDVGLSEYPVKDAQGNVLYHVVGGGIICDGAQKCACIFSYQFEHPNAAGMKITYNVGDCGLVDDCFCAHERKHLDDVECDPCKGLHRPEWKSNKEIECKHRRADMECLKAAYMQYFKDKDMDCFRLANVHYADLDKWVRKWCADVDTNGETTEESK
jgi:hypothetical protein